MKQITPDQFRQAVGLDPAWAAKLTEPVEILEFCEMLRSPITHLSPLIHFRGIDPNFGVASFRECADLKIAEGTFHGLVNFAASGIEQINTETLIITQPNHKGDAANFRNCEKLKVAEGTFPGWVSFARSGIARIDPKKLVITQPGHDGNAAAFWDCWRLKVIEGTFPGYVSFHNCLCINDVKKLKILKPDRNGQYLAIRGSKIETNPEAMDKLVLELSEHKSLAEIQKMEADVDEQELKLKAHFQKKIQRVMTAERKNAAVEIQID